MLSLSFPEEQIEKTNRALSDADIEEEKRDVIHREIGKFRESMKVFSRYIYIYVFRNLFIFVIYF